jgi:hypothetical protein
MWEGIVAVVFAAILVGSILNQLDWNRWEKLVARFDPMMFLPYWGFFAPDPGFAGNHVVYRDRVADEWGPWVEVPIPPRTKLEWIWNPGRFERKALLDLMNGFAKTRDPYEEVGAIQLSLAYLAMLTWVIAQPRGDTTATARQFAVVMTEGHGSSRELKVAVLSNEHPFD